MDKKKTMSREQAAKLYDELRNKMEKKYGKEGLKKLMDGKAPTSQAKTAAPAAKRASNQGRTISSARTSVGNRAAIALVLVFGAGKMALSGLEASGIGDVSAACASMAAAVPTGPTFSREEVKILTSLDSRRAELEDRSNKLDQRALEMSRLDREYAGRLTEIRELTEKLKGDRDKNERKNAQQFEQLANVYGSMEPKEAAELIQQLDVTIALALIERMPEKRIGQILSLMTPDKALTITNMLSGKK